MTDQKMCIINNMQFIDQIVKMHQLAFSNVLSGQVGTRFLRYFYSTLAKKGVIIGYVTDNDLLGFVSGIIDDKKIYSINYYFHMAWGVITHFYSVSMVINLLRFLKKTVEVSGESSQTELFSIIVSEGHKRKGIGKKLTQEFEKYLFSKNIMEYKVFTDMEFSSGYKLYDNLGFILHRELKLFGLTLRMYLRKIENG